MKRKRLTREEKAAAAQAAAQEPRQEPELEGGGAANGNLGIPADVIENPRTMDLDELGDAVSISAKAKAQQKMMARVDRVRDKLPGYLTSIDEYEVLGRGDKAQRDLQASLRSTNDVNVRLVEGLLRYIGDNPDEGAMVRHAAWMVLLNHHFSKTLGSHEEAEALLAGRMVRAGYLIQVKEEVVKLAQEKGEEVQCDLRAYGRYFLVPGDASAGTDDKRELQEALQGLYKRTREVVAKKQDAKAEKLKERATCPLENLLSDSPMLGYYFADVPTQYGDKSKGIDHLEGGRLLLVTKREQEKSGAEAVFSYVVDVTGREGNRAFERGFDFKGQVAKKELPFIPKLKVSTLRENKPPFIGGLHPAVGAKVRLMWYAIKRALSRPKEQPPSNEAGEADVASEPSSNGNNGATQANEGTA